MKTTRRLALVCSTALVVALTGVSPTRSAAESPRPLLALAGNGTTASIVKLDPVSLRRRPGLPKVYVGLHDIPYSFSPDGALLALGSGRTGSFVIVDMRRMRRLGKLESGFTSAIAWLSRSRFVVVEGRWVEEERLLAATVVEVGRRIRVVARHALPPGQELMRFEKAGRSAVLLLGRARRWVTPHWPFSPRTSSQTVVLDGSRRVPSRRIPRNNRSSDRYVVPGLAVAPSGERAYVVPGEGAVAEVDLSSLDVMYHDLRGPRHAAETGGRRAGTCSAKAPPAMRPGWSKGRLAVSGRDDWTELGPDGPIQRSAPAGLRLVDTDDWSEAVLDEEADWFVWGGGFLATASSEPRRLSRVHARRDTAVPPPTAARRLPAHRDRAYLALGSNEYRSHRVRVVELSSGRTLRTVRVPGWFYPLNRAVPESCWC